MAKVTKINHRNKPTAHYIDISWSFSKQVKTLQLEYLHFSELSDEKKTPFFMILIPTMPKVDQKNVFWGYFVELQALSHSNHVFLTF